MCGIAGYLNFNAPFADSVIRQMTDQLSHRGPDAAGYFSETDKGYQLSFGHRRLSIIDLSEHANQPLISQDNKYVIVFNGEIYNYIEIKEELVSKGYSFFTQSDTEVIVQAYAEWGKACLDRFIGMFAFVIYDRSKNQIFVARDRVGVKPFFFSISNEGFVFASELKSLHAYPQFRKELNHGAIAQYFMHGYIPAPHTIFNSTYKLMQGHYLAYDIDKRTYITEAYWNVRNAYNSPLVSVPYAEAIAETEKVLTKAFQYRMVADVPVGVFLSGGYDSACLTALLQKDSTRKIKTFTIGFNEAAFNEAEDSKRIASHLGTDHHELYFTVTDALQWMTDLSFYYDEPFSDSSALPTMLLSKFARQHVTVALSADGGDEIFGGYDKYHWIERNLRKVGMIPASIRPFLAHLLNGNPVTYFPFIKNNAVLRRKIEKAIAMLRNSDLHSTYLLSQVNFSERELNSLFKHPDTILTTFFDQDLSSITSNDPYSYPMMMDYQTYLVDDILQKVDRATMSSSLEGREPFLDQHIIEWAAVLPVEYKITSTSRKRILKDIVHRHIPKSMMDRPKRGFAIPIRQWLHKDLRSFVDAYFEPSYIKKQGIFNEKTIRSIYEGYYKSNSENDYRIWFILVFQMWYERWMND
jgi:asparagine synthase (glutamine-hydrolysing)